MFKNLRHLCLVYAAMLISFFALLPVSFAATSTPWQELGSAFPFTYTSVTSNTNIQNGNVKQLVVGFVNGVIEYYNPSTQTWINIPSPAPKGGTAVTALWCDWDNTINADGTINNNTPDILTGYADGSVWYYQANQNGSGTWNSLGTPNSNEQVTKFGGVSISSSNNLTGCNAETAVVPEGAVTPADYTNKQLSYTNGNGEWCCMLGSCNPNISTIDANSGNCGLSNGDIQQENGFDANISSNPIATTTYLDKNNCQNEYFYADDSGNYGVGYFSGLHSLSSQSTNFGSGTNNYVYTSVSSNVNGNQSVIVANNALRLFNVNSNYSSISSNPNLWSDPDNTPFNGLCVDWDGITPQTIVAGLTTGSVVIWNNKPGFSDLLPVSNSCVVLPPPPNFPAGNDTGSKTFAAFPGNILEIFNANGQTYIYELNENPQISSTQNLSQYFVVPVTGVGCNGTFTPINNMNIDNSDIPFVVNITNVFAGDCYTGTLVNNDTSYIQFTNEGSGGYINADYTAVQLLTGKKVSGSICIRFGG